MPELILAATVGLVGPGPVRAVPVNGEDFVVCHWFSDSDPNRQVGLGFANVSDDGIAYVEPWIKAEPGNYVECYALVRTEGPSRGTRSAWTPTHYQMCD